MGSFTDANIAAFQEATGIKPADGEWADRLERMSNLAFDLIKVIELERSGVRDGNGFWHGSEPVTSIVREIDEVCVGHRSVGPDGEDAPADDMPAYFTAEDLLVSTPKLEGLGSIILRAAAALKLVETGFATPDGLLPEFTDRAFAAWEKRRREVWPYLSEGDRRKVTDQLGAYDRACRRRDEAVARLSKRRAAAAMAADTDPETGEVLRYEAPEATRPKPAVRPWHKPVAAALGAAVEAAVEAAMDAGDRMEQLGFEPAEFGQLKAAGCHVSLYLVGSEWEIDIKLPNGSAVGGDIATDKWMGRTAAEIREANRKEEAATRQKRRR